MALVYAAKSAKKQHLHNFFCQFRVKTLENHPKKAIFWLKLMKNIRFGKRYFERVQYGTTLGTTTPALLADDQTAFS